MEAHFSLEAKLEEQPRWEWTVMNRLANLETKMEKMVLAVGMEAKLAPKLSSSLSALEDRLDVVEKRIHAWGETEMATDLGPGATMSDTSLKEMATDLGPGATMSDTSLKADKFVAMVARSIKELQDEVVRELREAASRQELLLPLAAVLAAAEKLVGGSQAYTPDKLIAACLATREEPVGSSFERREKYQPSRAESLRSGAKHTMPASALKIAWEDTRAVPADPAAGSWSSVNLEDSPTVSRAALQNLQEKVAFDEMAKRHRMAHQLVQIALGGHDFVKKSSDCGFPVFSGASSSFGSAVK